MERSQIFAKNLDSIRQLNGRSLGEFSKELGIPKSTLQTVLEHGNTTLDTAVRISDGLKLPLDTLLNDGLLCEKLDITQHLLGCLDWFRRLSPEDQAAVTLHFGKILEVIRKC